MYAEPSVRESVLAARVALIPDFEGQYLRNALIDRLPPSESARYELRIAPVQITIDNRAIRKDATSTRGEMRLVTTMEIYDLQKDETLATQPLQVVGGFNQLDNRFATLTSRDDLTRRLLNEMADQAQMQFALYAQSQTP